jgi:ketosteroid isomerase-like protein
MVSSNATRTRQYLQAVAALESYEAVAEFCSPEMVFHEFPNRIAPEGRTRDAKELREGFAKGKQLLKSQTYDVKRIVEAGDDVAVEVEWTGTLSIPVMNLPAGSVMKAFVAMFLTFRDGKIVSQRNYDCYPPFGN